MFEWIKKIPETIKCWFEILTAPDDQDQVDEESSPAKALKKAQAKEKLNKKKKQDKCNRNSHAGNEIINFSQLVTGGFSFTGGLLFGSLPATGVNLGAGIAAGGVGKICNAFINAARGGGISSVPFLMNILQGIIDIPLGLFLFGYSSYLAVLENASKQNNTLKEFESGTEIVVMESVLALIMAYLFLIQGYHIGRHLVNTPVSNEEIDNNSFKRR